MLSLSRILFTCTSDVSVSGAGCYGVECHEVSTPSNTFYTVHALNDDFSSQAVECGPGSQGTWVAIPGIDVSIQCYDPRLICKGQVAYDEQGKTLNPCYSTSRLGIDRCTEWFSPVAVLILLVVGPYYSNTQGDCHFCGLEVLHSITTSS